MPRVGARGALIALVVAGGAGVGARSWGFARADAALSGAGFRWSAAERSALGARWIGVSRPGVTVDEVSLSMTPSPLVRLRGATVDVEQALANAGESGGGGAGGGGAGGGLSDMLRVEIEDLDLYWGDRSLASDLSGPLWPAPDLSGPGVALRREGGAWVGEADRALDLEHLRGEAHARIRWADGLSFELTAPAAVVSHPALASSPLPPAPLILTGTWTSAGALTLEGSFAGVPFQGRGLLQPSTPSLDLAITVPDTPLATFVAAFGALIPEADRATLRGELGAEAELHLPGARWSVTPRASGLGADGVIPNPDGLREGPFTWSAPAADDLVAVRSAGEGIDGWVPLSRAGRLPAAVVAAEDAGFWTHPGYDLEAIQEALGAWSAGEERPRGGSTLTQQLAKNLFTDGERTLCRKLRELLYALELERRLGKDRILELYLNVVELGPGVYGVGAASDLFFLKRPEGLTWKEAAYLAAILPAPRTFYQSAYLGGRLPTARIERVIENLVRLGRLRPEEAAEVRRAPIRLVPPG